MGSATLTGTEFARVTRSYSSYSLSWIGSYTYTQDPVANTTTFTLYGSMYTGSSSNVRSANSTDVEQVNGVTISPPTPSAYRYSSSMEYGFSVNNGYSLFGSTTKTVTHNADGSFPSTSISIYSKNYHHNGLSASGAITAPAIDRAAPTVSASVTQSGESTVTLSVSANVNCNKWEYKVDSGSWVSFSTTNGTSASTSISLTTGASHTITARATKTYNQITGTSSAISVDKTASTVSCSVTDTSATAVTLSASSGVNCNKWEYRIGNGSWTTFSSTNGTSASVSITGLTAGSTGTIYVRVTKTANYVTSTASASYDKTAPSISSETLTDITANSMKLTVTTNVACRKFEYQVNNGSWVAFYDNASGTTSASATISGLSPAVSYTVNVRVTKKTNYVTASTSKTATTLGYSVITAVNNINVGSTNTITFTAYDANFYHRCRFQIGNTILVTENMGKVGATGSRTYTTAYTFPSSVLPSSSSATVTATIYTYTASSYSDASYIGSTSKTFTLSVPNSLQPSVSIALSPYNTNSWIDGKGLYVGGYTRINIAVTSSASSGSSISSTSISPESTTVSTNNYRTAILASGSRTVSVTVADSRGRSASTSSSVTFLSYSSPSVSQFATERGTYADGTWTADTNGNHIRATVTTSCSLTTQGNTATATVRCVIGGTSTAPNATSGNDYYWTGTSAETSYVVTVSVTDSVGNTSTFSSTVSAIAVPFNLNTTMPAAAFGKVAEKAKKLEIAQDWGLVANGKNNRMRYLPYSWSTGDTYGQAGYARIATITLDNLQETIHFRGTRRLDKTTFDLYFQVDGNGDIRSFYADYPVVYSATYPFNAFVIVTGTLTYDIYVQKINANDWITIWAEVGEWSQGSDAATITYSPNTLTSVPSGAVMATGRPLSNMAKFNTMSNLPYTWWFQTDGADPQAGYNYYRIATVTVAGLADEAIEFKVTRRFDNKPVTLYLKFASQTGSDPTTCYLCYDSVAGTSGGASNFEAFVYKTATSTWDIYVHKAASSDVITVATYSPVLMQYGSDGWGVNITYTYNKLSTIPSGAIMAVALPLLSATPTITKSSGNCSVLNTGFAREGRVCQLYLRFRVDSDASPSSNIFVGTVSGIPLPVWSAKSVDYTGRDVYIFTLSSTGEVSLHLSGTDTAYTGSTPITSIVYLTNSAI